MFGVPLDEMTPDVRRQAKAINFGVIYGITVGIVIYMYRAPGMLQLWRTGNLLDTPCCLGIALPTLIYKYPILTHCAPYLYFRYSTELHRYRS